MNYGSRWTNFNVILYVCLTDVFLISLRRSFRVYLMENICRFLNYGAGGIPHVCLGF